MANDFKAGPSHRNSDVNDGKFYIITFQLQKELNEGVENIVKQN